MGKKNNTGNNFLISGSAGLTSGLSLLINKGEVFSMKIFLTGATGFLGEYVVDQLIKGKHTVFALARSPESLAHIKKINIVQGDITSPETGYGQNF